MSPKFRAAVSVVVLLAFMGTSSQVQGQAPAPRDSHRMEKDFTPRALGIGEKDASAPGPRIGKWLLIGGLALAAGIVLYLVFSKKSTSSTTPPPPGAKVGAIATASDPPGAKIFLDGSDTGQMTNSTLASVAVGSHMLLFDLASYGKWEGPVTVVENQTANITATLAPYVYAFVTKWGSFGTGDGQFDRPSGLAVDGSDNVYVTDSFNQRVQKFTSTGSYIAKWGGPGTGDGQFSLIDGIAVDAASNIYVTDGALTDGGIYNHRVQKFAADDRYLGQWGSYGNADGQFYTPVGPTISKTGYLYIVDMDLGRVQKFTTSGAYLLKWGSLGAGDSQFQRPHFSAVDADGNVYVSEYDGHRVQKFTADGGFLTKWGTPGAGDGQFQHAAGIAIDRAGYVLVCDSLNHRVQKFTRAGAFVTKWGSPGGGDGQFNETAAVVEDSQGNIYVSDYRNYRIQKFRLTTATAMAAAKITYTPLPTREAKKTGPAASAAPGPGGKTGPGTEGKAPPAGGKKERIKTID